MADELEKTCENCKYEFESCEGEHCRHCIHSADEHFEPKIIVPTEAEIRNQAIDEFATTIKEALNQEFPRNYESAKPYFTLENARLIVDEIAEQMKG